MLRPNMKKALINFTMKVSLQCDARLLCKIIRTELLSLPEHGLTFSAEYNYGTVISLANFKILR